jgi:anthranilate/para-aminobenzoate synthase component II
MKIYGACPATASPGNAPIAAGKMDSAINEFAIEKAVSGICFGVNSNGEATPADSLSFKQLRKAIENQSCTVDKKKKAHKLKV